MFSCHVVQGFDSFSSGTDCNSKEGVRKALVLIFLQEIPKNEETGRCWAIQTNLAEQTRQRKIWLTRIKFFGMIICYYCGIMIICYYCGIVVLIHKSKMATNCTFRQSAITIVIRVMLSMNICFV